MSGNTQLGRSSDHPVLDALILFRRAATESTVTEIGSLSSHKIRESSDSGLHSCITPTKVSLILSARTLSVQSVWILKMDLKSYRALPPNKKKNCFSV